MTGSVLDPHEHRISAVVWGVLVLALANSVAIVFLALYLGDRQGIADHRNEVQRQGVCAVLDEIPEHRSAAVDEARDSRHFDCGPPRAIPHPSATTKAHASAHLTPSARVDRAPETSAPTVRTVTATVTAAPGRKPTVAPAPTVTRTVAPPAPAPRPTTCLPLVCSPLIP